MNNNMMISLQIPIYILYAYMHIFFILDINECTRETDNCQHNCHNSCGGYYCSCRSGYTGRTSCSGMNGFTSKLNLLESM